jgi:hypothetical protein
MMLDLFSECVASYKIDEAFEYKVSSFSNDKMIFYMQIKRMKNGFYSNPGDKNQ